MDCGRGTIVKLSTNIRYTESMPRSAGILADAERTKHERLFQRLWIGAGGPDLVPQFKFLPNRRYRADFACIGAKLLIECHGSHWVAGTGHSSGVGIKRDREKALAAYLAGWQVVELVPEQITADVVRRLIERITPLHLDVCAKLEAIRKSLKEASPPIKRKSPLARLVSGLSLPSSRQRMMAQTMGCELGVLATADALAALAELKGGGA